MYMYSGAIAVVVTALIVSSSFELGSGPAEIRSADRINDGAQHTVMATRYAFLLSFIECIQLWSHHDF